MAKPLFLKNQHKIHLSPPHFSGNEVDLMAHYFQKKNNFFEPVQEFENKISKYLETDKHCVALNSATSAIHLALKLIGVSQGDEVICQSFTFVASANPIVYLRAKPIFVDSEPETWNISPEFLEKAILDRILKGKKPKAIIVVHLYGMPAKIAEILQISQKYEIPVIEDAAEALGSKYRGKFCGSFGDFGILSFNFNKVITTFGGGILLCKTEEQKEKALFLATQAKDSAPHYQHSEIGYNYSMSPLSAALGLSQMEVLEDRISARRKAHDFYVEIFKDFYGVKVFSEPNSDFYSNHWLSAFVIDEEITGFKREDLMLEFLENGIESRPLWKPMHLQPVFEDCEYFGDNVAENLFENGLCLPSGSNLIKEDLDRIKSVILSFKN